MAHRTVVLVALASIAGPLAPAQIAAAAPHLPGLNPGELAVRAGCPATAPGYARCAAQQLVYRASGNAVGNTTPGAARSRGAGQSTSPAQPAGQGSETPAAGSSFTPHGYGPHELQSAYGLTALSAGQGSEQTLAVVDAYDDPNAEADLGEYRSQFGLSACTTANGCFTKLEQAGTEPSPHKDDWGIETSLDLDMASAICPNCKILLVEAATPLVSHLVAAEQTAANSPGVVAISNSYGLEEGKPGNPIWTAEQAAAYSHAGIAITASAGDNEYEVEFPAVLGTVTAVGGTSLTKSGGAWSQAAWSGTGGGCSVNVAKPPWQAALGAGDGGCAMRTNNDVSADADPYTGVAVYDTFNSQPGWVVLGGTSAAAPIVAGFYALIGQQAGDGGASWDYAHTNFFTDVRGGFDRSGCTSYLCEAVIGYDGPTGLGTPDGTGEAVRGSEETPAPVSSGTSPPGESAASAPASSTALPTVPAGSPAVAVLSGLSWTRAAVIALHRARPQVAGISFVFELSIPARVLVTLQRQVRVHGHLRFRTLPYTLTLSAGQGRSTGRLRAHRALAAGVYRLTLTPAGGAPRSITLHVA